MSDKKVLVIDDSSTIRKLVDSHLSPAGYAVTMAANAEDGLEIAEDLQPDLILLDHQLPGTTGFEVATKLSQIPALAGVPVVISSTLRKKAYVEYAELDNVVDMLPKPYTEDLLRTTVANAIETAAMVVSSQSNGTAVPEIIGEAGEADLTGSLSSFGLREVLDFLNNGRKNGVLEVEAERFRLWFYLGDGRLQGVSATGLSEAEVDAITDRLPHSLTNLSAVLRLTINGRGSAEIDGLVQLLDQKVLDPRLTASLLRFQAAALIGLAFDRPLKSYSFTTGAGFPALHRDLPLDASLLSLLVEHAIHVDQDGWQQLSQDQTFARRNIRGQNLDRAGLSAKHMKIMNSLAEPVAAQHLSERLGWSLEETLRVLRGFVQAELVELRAVTGNGKVVVFEPVAANARTAKSDFERNSGAFAVKVVRDPLALQLLLRRTQPDAIVFDAEQPAQRQTIAELVSAGALAESTLTIAIGGGAELAPELGLVPNASISRPYTARETLQWIGEAMQSAGTSNAAVEPPATSHAPEAHRDEAPIPTTVVETSEAACTPASHEVLS
ncbi:MAG: response regulator [Planctomycetota bacterium]